MNDFDLDIKNESTKGDCVFDQVSSQADTNATNGAIIEVDATLETPESVENLLEELFERRKESEVFSLGKILSSSPSPVLACICESCKRVE